MNPTDQKTTDVFVVLTRETYISTMSNALNVEIHTKGPAPDRRHPSPNGQRKSSSTFVKRIEHTIARLYLNILAKLKIIFYIV